MVRADSILWTMPGYRLDQSPAYLLHQVALPHDAIFERWAVRGLTMRQLAVLTALAERDGVNQMTITQRTGIDRSTMTEIVGRLARRGRSTSAVTGRTCVHSCCGSPTRVAVH